MRILLTGPAGQIGHELANRLERLGDVVALERRDLDLARPADVPGVVAAAAPDVIVNAAGYTAVDQAEHEPELAHVINGESAGALARAARGCGAAFVHYSTDYVFDGATDRSYRPGDEPRPINAYGRSKLAGEQAVRAAGGAFLILRTSWIYSERRRNFLLSVLGRAAQGAELAVVGDQVGCPTPAPLVAELTVAALERGLARAGDRWTLGGREGIHHVACAGCTSWFGFARAILDLRQWSTAVRQISSCEYAAPAARPACSALDGSGFEAAFGLALPHWHAALVSFMRERWPWASTAA